jgi:hypothetical protein
LHAMCGRLYLLTYGCAGMTAASAAAPARVLLLLSSRCVTCFHAFYIARACQVAAALPDHLHLQSTHTLLALPAPIALLVQTWCGCLRCSLPSCPISLPGRPQAGHPNCCGVTAMAASTLPSQAT